MKNHNIEIGIDLGTTNSEVAVFINNQAEIVKNSLGDDYTPSVFGINKANSPVVGKKAYQNLFLFSTEQEIKNNKAEIKRLMGTSNKVNFSRINKDLTPEEISAEILKSLKQDAISKKKEINTTGVVITVPAYFSIVQAEATKRAGNIAGFEYVILLQEPIAAAISYGFLNSKDENWLVYDLGGGTFDVALISSKDSTLTVLGHNGDNFLGGKDIDWAIVDKIIVPKLLDNYTISEFNRGNSTYAVAFAKLKYYAEQAKIQLSRQEKTIIEVENIGCDDKGNEIFINIDFSVEQFNQIIDPLINRTIELTEQTIQESGINRNSVSKIVLVGGPTQIPHLRTTLEVRLGIPVDYSVDPLTAVAKGACLYGMSQRIPDKYLINENNLSTNALNIKLDYESTTSETEEMITGIIEELKDKSDGYFVQIQSENGSYCSSKIPVKNGKFFDTVALEQQKTNLYWIYLFDDKSNQIDLSSDSFSITHGLVISGVPIPHSIGVGVGKRDAGKNFELVNIFHKYFERSSKLPLKKTEPFKTVKTVKKGELENALPIIIYEGESDIPDRNQEICRIELTGEHLLRDLNENTDVEITIEINESREVNVEAYISEQDLVLNARGSIYADDPSINELEEEYEDQVERISQISANCSREENAQLEKTLDEIEQGLQNAENDEDEKIKANTRIKELKMNIDKLEKDKEIPQLIEEFNEETDRIQEMIEDLCDEQDQEKFSKRLSTLKDEGNKAISNNDKFLLQRINEQLSELGSNVWYSSPIAWQSQFRQLAEGNYNFINKTEAEHYLEKGKKAFKDGDVHQLKRCVRNLMNLLPINENKEMKDC